MPISVMMGCLLVYFITQGACLFETLQNNFHTEKSFPGQTTLLWIITVVGLSLFLRMIFVSFEDLGKLAKIESMVAGTQTWQSVLVIEMVVEIFSAVSLMAAMFLIYRVETAVSLANAYRPVKKQE